MFKMMYCSKCGDICKGQEGYKCIICNHIMYEINSKWGINVETYDAIVNQIKYGEKTQEQCDKEEEAFLREFREEVVKKHPDYDPYLYEHRDEIIKQKVEEANRRADELPQYMKDAIKDSINSPTITCPYCKSTNTKKLSTWQRGLSFSFFGFGSSKVGKQWHCNSCGSDF